MGDARTAPALHPLQGDGLGRGRPDGRRASRGYRPARAGRPLGGAARHDPRRRPRARLRRSSADTFVQSYGSTELDASLLLIPRVGFLPGGRPAGASAPSTPIQRELTRGRSRAALPHRRPPTTACPAARACSSPAPSGWSTRCTASGRAAGGAPSCSSGCSTLRNDVGLLSEEWDPVSRAAAGQHPAGVQPLRAGGQRPAAAHEPAPPQRPAPARRARGGVMPAPVSAGRSGSAGRPR